MKRKLAFILVTSLTCMSLAACGNSTANNESSTEDSEETTEASADAEASDEEAETESDEPFIDLASLEIGDESYLEGINTDDYVTLGEYIGLSAGIEKPEISDDLVDYYINYMYMGDVEGEEITDRAVQDGDIVNIDYVGTYKDSGEAFDGGTAEGVDLTIGSNTYIDGFEDGLIGAEIGDTVDLDLTFPENYSNNPDLAGVEVIFTVTVNSITVKPDLSDELVQSFDVEGVSTVDELKAYMRGQLTDQAMSSVQNNVLSDLNEKSEVLDPPAELVNAYQILMYTSVEATVEQYVAAGYTTSVNDYFNNIISYYGYSGDAAEFLKEQATSQAKSVLLLGAVAEKEGITITDADKQQEIDDFLAGTGYESIDEYSEKTGLDIDKIAAQDALTQKVMDFLVENCEYGVTTDTEETEAAETEAAE